MRLMIGEYEVSINAKTKYSKGYNNEDTKALLNSLSCFIGEAAISHRNRGSNAIAKEAYKYRDAIYETLDSLGYYDNVR